MFWLPYDKARPFLEEHGIEWPSLGFDIGPGWFPIVQEALVEMIAAGWNKQLVQVKQKFCGLRLYIGQETPEVSAIIGRAEERCAIACEGCGEPHGLEIPRGGQALCEKCASLLKEAWETELAKR